MLCTIVGAGPGLGAALADKFVAEGYRVGMICRHPDRLADWHTHQPRHDQVRIVAADAGEESELVRGLEELRRWGSDCHVLVYNAADMRPDDIEDLTPAHLADTMRTNLDGVLTAVSQVVPAMRAHQHGTILITGGGLALEPYPEWASLSAGKAALRSIALNLHKRLLPEGIHVAVIAICGIVAPGGAFDPHRIAEAYWELHTQPLGAAADRELVYLPPGADPFYNDPGRVHRRTSQPITELPPTDRA